MQAFSTASKVFAAAASSRRVAHHGPVVAQAQTKPRRCPRRMSSGALTINQLHTTSVSFATRKKKSAATEAAADSSPAAAEPEKASQLKKKFLDFLEDEWAEAEADTLEVVMAQTKETIFFDIPKPAKAKRASDDYDDSFGVAADAIVDGQPTVPVRKTYLGGLPLAPPSSSGAAEGSPPDPFAWPVRTLKGSNGVTVTLPLEFLFQVDLAEIPKDKLAPADAKCLPASGYLQFFASNLFWTQETHKEKLATAFGGPEGRVVEPRSSLEGYLGQWLSHVRIVPASGELVPQIPPVSVDLPARIFGRLEFASRIGITMRPTHLFEKNLTVEEGGPTPFDTDVVNDLIEQKYPTAPHWLFGMANQFQQPVELEAAQNDAFLRGEDTKVHPVTNKDALKWRCLLQITADAETGVLATDDADARLWFMIKEDDLRANKFGNAIVIHQR